jgi:hypothetical protein
VRSSFIAPRRVRPHCEVDHDPGLVRPHGCELPKRRHHLLGAAPAVDLALDALPEVVGVDDGNVQPTLAHVADELAEVRVGQTVVAARPRGFVLNQDNRAASSGRRHLQVPDLLGNGGDVARAGLKERTGVRPHGDVWHRAEPCGQASHVKILTDERTDAQDRHHAGTTHELYEVADVVLALEIELPRAGLVPMPGKRHIDRVQAGELRGVDTIGPARPRNSVERNGAGDEPDSAAIEHEAAAVVGDGGHAGCRSWPLPPERGGRESSLDAPLGEVGNTDRLPPTRTARPAAGGRSQQ